ncbi:MAG: cytochrome ubiquinol oxidase subunit I [Acidobacteriota bacterium]
MDVTLLSRIQFAMTIAFHYLYPPLSIGLGVVLVVMEGLYLRTRVPIYQQMTRFWVRVFGLTFALGVATGIVMEFEFGTNWASYSRFVGDVFGSALAAEGIFAFFLESGFLALLLFGWDKVGPRLHFFATLMVCLGAHFSAIWIVVANSWMQTPAGCRIAEHGLGPRAEVTDFWAMVFNPSAAERLTHTVLGAWQAGAFLVVSVSAYYLLNGRHAEFARRSLRVGVALGLVASLGSLATGHVSAEGVSRHQPAKLAAMEAHFPASAPADMYVFGWVDEDSRHVHGVALPGMLSWILHGNATAPVTGLSAFAPEDRPPVQVVFQAYHLMVAIGMGLIGLSLAGVFYAMRRVGSPPEWLLRLLVLSVLGPQIANQAGWMTAEVGRQPWIVYGVMRTSEGVSRSVSAEAVVFSLVLFTLVYMLLFALFLYLLDSKIKHGPLPEDLTASPKRA